MSPDYQETQYGEALPAPMGTVTTEMSKISLETQRKNETGIFNLLNTQASDLQYLNGEETLFTSLLSSPVTQQVKLVYGMGPVTVTIGQTLIIANKILTIYRDGVPDIRPSHTLILDATLRDKVLIKNLTPEDV